MNKRTLKNRFFSKRFKIEQKTARIEADFEKHPTRNFDFRLRWTFLKVGKLVSRSAQSQS